MAYVAGSTRLMIPGMGNGPSLWHCSGIDPHTTIDDDDYFSDGDDIGMREGDAVMYYDTNLGTGTLHFVRTQVTEGAASVSAATLSS